MKLEDHRTGIEALPRDECLALLATDEIGRLAIVHGGVPEIFPVNYRLDGDTIVFRTDPGTKLDHARRGESCFEIDSFDRELRSGWSVIVTGRVEEVTTFDRRALDHVQALGVDPWAGGLKSHWLRLVPSRITGRRVSHD